MILFSFLLCLAIFAGIGLASSKLSRKTTDDYYLASQSIKPWLVGLSAVATNNSGYMFIGVIGYTYSSGVEAFWLMIGWLVGDFVGSHFIHKPLRMAANKTGENSFSAVIASWQGSKMLTLQRSLAIISFVFLMAYAAAQLVAGSKALNVLLGWPTYAGAIVGAILIVAYCFAGGIRASIWTDAAQSMVMVCAMALLLVISLINIGGIGSAWSDLNAIPDYLNIMPEANFLPGVWGLLLFIIGWGFAGFSVVGQPHVMVRFMALENESQMVRARAWYYGWFTVFYFMATAVGMLARILLPDTQSFDAELALPTMALNLLDPWFAGLVLAGIFAATMSTADSLVLSSSAVISNDLFTKPKSLLIAKVSTLVVTFGALLWALGNTQSVFSLVVMAWSALGSVFAPILLALVFGLKIKQSHALIMFAIGLVTSLVWRQLGWHTQVYEGLPAITLALTYIVVVNAFFKSADVLKSGK